MASPSSSPPFLTPEADFNLIDCDWRVQLDPGCPYVGDLTAVSASVLWFCLFTAVFQWSAIAYRVFIQKRKVLARSNAWYLPFNPHELDFWGAAMYNTFRIFQLMTLVYFNQEAPLFLKGFLFSAGPVVGGWSMTYYWISLVAALPRDHLIDHAQVLSRFSPINTAGGLAIFPLLFVMPFFEGMSAHFIKTNEPAARTSLTTLYSIWGTVFFTLTVGVLLFGLKIVGTLDETMRFHRDKPLVDSRTQRNLLKALKLIKPTVLLISGLSGATSSILFLLVIARYYIWAHREASLAICIIFNFTPPLFTLLYTGMIIVVDARSKSSTGDQGGTASAGNQSGVKPSSEHPREKALKNLAPPNEDAAIENFRSHIESVAYTL